MNSLVKNSYGFDFEEEIYFKNLRPLPDDLKNYYELENDILDFKKLYRKALKELPFVKTLIMYCLSNNYEFEEVANILKKDERIVQILEQDFNDLKLMKGKKQKNRKVF